MASADDTCQACGFDDGVSYEAEGGRFRIWCALCGHSTGRYSDPDLARLEWRGSQKAPHR